MPKPEARVAGIVLAAGAGTRYGGAKALARDPDGTPWLPRAVRALLAGGCSPVLAVLGSEADAAEGLLTSAFLLDAVDADTPDSPVRIVRADNWRDGVSASIRAGLSAAERLDPLPEAVAIVTVDVPSLSAAMVRRLVGDPRITELAGALRQASFSGRPGHPVVVGRAHWSRMADTLHGDTGARPYLVANGVAVVECSDLGSGLDVDRPVGGSDAARGPVAG
jgi:CTP:molybdopterin cytidylyltransferase MocA